MMNRIFALIAALAFALGTTGIASAGMQGQGGKPDAKKPEYKEQNPGDTGKEKAAPTGAAEQRGGAAREPAVRGEKGTGK